MDFDPSPAAIDDCVRSIVEALEEPGSGTDDPAGLPLWTRVVCPVASAEDAAALCETLRLALANRRLPGHCELVTLSLDKAISRDAAASDPTVRQLSPSFRHVSHVAHPSAVPSAFISLAVEHLRLRRLVLGDIPMKTKQKDAPARRSYDVVLLHPLAQHFMHDDASDLSLTWGSSVAGAIDACGTRCVHRLTPLAPDASPTQVLVRYVMNGNTVACVRTAADQTTYVSHLIQSASAPGSRPDGPQQLVIRCLFRAPLPAASSAPAAPVSSWMVRELEALTRSAMLPTMPVAPAIVPGEADAASAALLRELTEARGEQLRRATAPLLESSTSSILPSLLNSDSVIREALEQLQKILVSATVSPSDNDNAAKAIRVLQGKAAKLLIEAVCDSREAPRSAPFWKELGAAAVRWASPAQQNKAALYVEERCKRQVELLYKTEPPTRLSEAGARSAGDTSAGDAMAVVRDMGGMTQRERDDLLSGDRNNEHASAAADPDDPSASPRPRKRQTLELQNIPAPQVDLGTSDTLLSRYWARTKK